MAKKVKKKELGKGIRALLSNIESQTSDSSNEEVVEVGNNMATIPVNSIEVNPFQPRKEFDEQALSELSESIKVHGLIQPITVRRMAEGEYQLISGERRLRASKLAGLTDIPAYVREADSQEMLEMALVENIQREQLNAIEVAITYQRLIDECNLTHEKLSERVGKNRSSVSNFLRLLKLPPSIQKSLKAKVISMGHARALLGVDNLETQLVIFKEVIENKLSVRATENLIRSYLTPKKGASKNESLPPEFNDVQNNLRSFFGSKVKIKRGKGGTGQIVIPYLSNTDLNRILELIEE